MEQKYTPYSSYSAEEHRKQIEANQEAVRQSKQYMADYYDHQRIEEEKRNAEFNNQSIEGYEPDNHEEQMAKVVVKFMKFMKFMKDYDKNKCIYEGIRIY